MVRQGSPWKPANKPHLKRTIFNSFFPVYIYWKVLAYSIYARVVDVSEIERVSAANE